MSAVVAALAVLLGGRNRLSAETWAIIENASYIARRDTRLCRIAEHIVQRLSEEGWNDVEVREGELITYKVVARRHRQDGRAFGGLHRVGRAMLLHYGVDYAEYLVWLFEKKWERTNGYGCAVFHDQKGANNGQFPLPCCEASKASGA